MHQFSLFFQVQTLKYIFQKKIINACQTWENVNKTFGWLGNFSCWHLLSCPWPTGQWQYTYGHHRRTTDGWWVGALIMIELSSNLSSWHCPNDDGMASSDKRGEKHFNKMNVHLMKKKETERTHTHMSLTSVLMVSTCFCWLYFCLLWMVLSL